MQELEFHDCCRGTSNPAVLCIPDFILRSFSAAMCTIHLEEGGDVSFGCIRNYMSNAKNNLSSSGICRSVIMSC